MAAEPIRQPVLLVHGTADPTVLPATTTGSEQHVAGAFQAMSIDACGHFPHEERTDVVLPGLLSWLGRI